MGGRPYTMTDQELFGLLMAKDEDFWPEDRTLVNGPVYKRKMANIEVMIQSDLSLVSIVGRVELDLLRPEQGAQQIIKAFYEKHQEQVDEPHAKGEYARFVAYKCQPDEMTIAGFIDYLVLLRKTMNVVRE